MSPGGVLLIMDDSIHRTMLAMHLRTLGCEIYFARDLDEAADVIRAGVPKEIVVVYLGQDRLSASDIRSEIARRLPGRSVSIQDTFDLGADDVGDASGRMN